MNKDQLNARIKELQTQKDQLTQNIYAYEGAIQDCQYWLQQLEQEPTEANV